MEHSKGKLSLSQFDNPCGYGIDTEVTNDEIMSVAYEIEEQRDELLEACKDARRQIEMMVERIPIDRLVASDSMMISQLQQAINKAEGK